MPNQPRKTFSSSPSTRSFSRAMGIVGFSMMRETSINWGFSGRLFPAIVPKPLRSSGPMRLTAEMLFPLDLAAN